MNPIDFVAREREIKKLQKVWNSRRSEFVAVYGRRRVGKTFLVRTMFKNEFTFYSTAIANVDKKQQLFNFYTSLKKYRGNDSPEKPPKNWFEAFQQLITFLEQSKVERKLLFLDELPWFDNKKSDFIPSLEHFWNHWASARTDIVLVTCGSAASWMINKLINHKGGLHNRVTSRIKLEPFTLKETEIFLKIKNPAIDRYQVIQLYMAMGGIPFYLNEVATEWSAVQNIEQICFASDGLLRTEFNNLFNALFSKAERHISIVKAISTKAKGLTRQEIVELTKLSSNGQTTKLLNELEESGFIRKYIPFQKKKRNSLYQLIDFYTLFYLRFIQKANPYDQNIWINSLETSSYRAWSGYAYEQICLYHIQQIKEALGIAGIYTQTFSWRSTSKNPKQKGAQIDLLIDRRDHVINLCEVKFSIAPFVITKSYAAQLQQKISIFKAETGTNKAIYLTMISTYGVTQNTYAMNLVRNNLTMDALFQ
ncbi:MAG: AAA family ATPase [Chitinophagales bacterium]